MQHFTCQFATGNEKVGVPMEELALGTAAVLSTTAPHVVGVPNFDFKVVWGQRGGEVGGRKNAGAVRREEARDESELGIEGASAFFMVGGASGAEGKDLVPEVADTAARNAMRRRRQRGSGEHTWRQDVGRGGRGGRGVGWRTTYDGREVEDEAKLKMRRGA